MLVNSNAARVDGGAHPWCPLWDPAARCRRWRWLPRSAAGRPHPPQVSWNLPPCCWTLPPPGLDAQWKQEKAKVFFDNSKYSFRTVRVEKRCTSPGDILGDDSQFLSDWTVHQLTQRLPVERSDVAMYLQCCGGVKQKKHGTPGVRTCLRIQPAAHWWLGSFGTVSYQWNSLSKYGALHRVFPLDPEWGCCRNWLHWCSAMKTGIHKSTPHPLAVVMSRPLPRYWPAPPPSQPRTKALWPSQTAAAPLPSLLPALHCWRLPGQHHPTRTAKQRVYTKDVITHKKKKSLAFVTYSGIKVGSPRHDRVCDEAEVSSF